MDASTEERRNTTIPGSGTLAGGVYGKVKIAGAGKVDGDIDAEKVSAAGSARFSDGIKAAELKTAGSCSVGGDVEVEELRSTGSMDIQGGVTAKTIRGAGSFGVSGGVKAENIRISGGLKAGSGVEAERFRAKGSFHVSGLLNADRVEVELDGSSSATDIGGSMVEVRTAGGRSSIPFFGGRGYLDVQSIEADEISLESTRARTVRGRRVRIGDGCEIDTVEYTESLEVSDKAEVRSQTKSTGK